MSEPISRFFERLGFPLKNARWSWGAASQSGILLRAWDDETNAARSKVRLLRGPGRRAGRPGDTERVSHLHSLWLGECPGFVVFAKASDITAIPRGIGSFDSEYIYPIRALVSEPDGSIWGELGSPIPVGQSFAHVAPPLSTNGFPLELPNARPVEAGKEAWDEAEVAATVADYFHMLRLELIGQAYNKSEHRRRLQSRLRGRTEASIEMKHRNISAILLELGVMPIRGYKPLYNYQQMLAEEVGLTLKRDRTLDRIAIEAVEQHAEQPILHSLADFVTSAPRIERRIREELLPWDKKTPVRRDYLQREARNSALGAAGELLALEYEVHRLHAVGRTDLADRIEHCSRSRGDGLGFDILSYEETGKERFIEVKTTAFSEFTPFFVSDSERRFSTEQGDLFHLYRIYELRQKPRMYSLVGSIDQTCDLHPTTYRAFPI